MMRIVSWDGRVDLPYEAAILSAQKEYDGWHVVAEVEGKTYYLKSYDKEEDAVRAIQDARDRYAEIRIWTAKPEAGFPPLFFYQFA